MIKYIAKMPLPFESFNGRLKLYTEERSNFAKNQNLNAFWYTIKMWGSA